MKLSKAIITGFVTRPQTDGVCAHCGMGIKHCVVVIDPESGGEVTIGTTCAERVGVDATMIRNRETHAQRKDREARQQVWEDARAKRNAPIIAAREANRQKRAKLLAPTIEALRDLESPFFDDLAWQLERSQSLSPRQAECVCRAFSATGRRNKKNADKWDARMNLLCD